MIRSPFFNLAGFTDRGGDVLEEVAMDQCKYEVKSCQLEPEGWIRAEKILALFSKLEFLTGWSHYRRMSRYLLIRFIICYQRGRSFEKQLLHLQGNTYFVAALSCKSWKFSPGFYDALNTWALQTSSNEVEPYQWSLCIYIYSIFKNIYLQCIW